MATGGWDWLRLPRWRMRLNFAVDHLRSITNVSKNHRAKLVCQEVLAGALLFLLIVSTIWHGLLIWAAGAALVLFLQEVVDPTPLFWAVPWEAMQLVLSRRVRVNHFWLHRTQRLVRESPGCLGKLDGFATRDGFVLMGAGLTKAEILWASTLTLRAMCGQASAKKATRGCKTTRFLLALWLIAGGLLWLSIWRGEVDLTSAVLLSAVCGASGHGLAGPAEKLLNPWVTLVAFCDDKMYPGRLKVESFAVPHFRWFRGRQAFRVRHIVEEAISSGIST